MNPPLCSQFGHKAIIVVVANPTRCRPLPDSIRRNCVLSYVVRNASTIICLRPHCAKVEGSRPPCVPPLKRALVVWWSTTLSPDTLVLAIHICMSIPPAPGTDKVDEDSYYLRGNTLNRTYGAEKNLYTYQFLLANCGLIYYDGLT